MAATPARVDGGQPPAREPGQNVGRSEVLPIADSVNHRPSPMKVDFQILDEETSTPIPGRLLVVGDHPAFPDKRVFETKDRLGGIVEQRHAIRGTTTDVGDGADAPLLLPGGGTYRIYASRGTEWSIASQPVTGTADVSLAFNLRQVNPTPGYLGADFRYQSVARFAVAAIRSAVSSASGIRRDRSRLCRRPPADQPRWASTPWCACCQAQSRRCVRTLQQRPSAGRFLREPRCNRLGARAPPASRCCRARSARSGSRRRWCRSTIRAAAIHRVQAAFSPRIKCDRQPDDLRRLRDGRNMNDFFRLPG
jgi:hypothetical protein